MNERKMLRQMSHMFNTNIENIPSVLKRLKREVSELEHNVN